MHTEIHIKIHISSQKIQEKHILLHQKMLLMVKKSKQENLLFKYALLALYNPEGQGKFTNKNQLRN